MPFILQPRRLLDHPHLVRLEDGDGRAYVGWTSPALDRAGRRRDLILLTVRFGDLPDALQADFAAFTAALRDLSDKAAVVAAKLAVDRIMQGEAIDAAGRFGGDAVRVAVHKMGPVPALLLDRTPVEFPDQTLALVVGLPAGFAGKGSMIGERVETSATALFRSLRRVSLGRLLETYIEDVAEHLADMSEKLGTARALKRLKAVRAIHAQSILEKLHVLMPSPQGWAEFHDRTKDEAGIESHDIKQARNFQRVAPRIAEALVSVCSVNRLCGDYCRLIGFPPGDALIGGFFVDDPIKLRGVTYQDRGAITTLLQTYPGLDIDLEELSPVYSEVAAIMAAYRDGDLHRLVHARRSRTTGGIASFAIFLLIATAERTRRFGHAHPQAGEVLIFLSRKNDSPFCKMVGTALDEAAARIEGVKVRHCTFQGQGGEGHVTLTVLAQLHLADMLWAAIPELGDDPEEQLRWIYAESVHAAALGKRTILIARNEADRKRAIQVMKTLAHDPLSRRFHDQDDDLRADWLRATGDMVAIVTDDPEKLVERCEALLRSLWPQIQQDRRRDLLAGYLGFFEPRDLRLLEQLMAIDEGRSFEKKRLWNRYSAHVRKRDGVLPHPGQRAGLEQTFEALQRRSARYALPGHSGSVGVLSAHNRRFSVNLARVLRRLTRDHHTLETDSEQRDIMAALDRAASLGTQL